MRHDELTDSQSVSLKAKPGSQISKSFEGLIISSFYPDITTNTITRCGQQPAGISCSWYMNLMKCPPHWETLGVTVSISCVRCFQSGSVERARLNLSEMFSVDASAELLFFFQRDAVTSLTRDPLSSVVFCVFFCSQKGFGFGTQSVIKKILEDPPDRRM